MTTQENREKYVVKIAALLRKAEGTDNAQEAETFFAKAQELMTKWAIDDAELAAHQGDKASEKIIRKQVILQMAFYLEDAQVLQAAAIPNQCRVLVTGDKKTALRGPGRGERIAILVGFESDVARVEMLYASLTIQMARAMQNDIQEVGVEYMERAEKKRYRISYRLGFASGLMERLKKAKEETVAQGAPGTDLVLADRMTQVDRWLGPTKARKGGRRNLDWNAIDSGTAAARRADLGQPRAGSGDRRALN
jgi:hypothetical protein